MFFPNLTFNATPSETLPACVEFCMDKAQLHCMNEGTRLDMLVIWGFLFILIGYIISIYAKDEKVRSWIDYAYIVGYMFILGVTCYRIYLGL